MDEEKEFLQFFNCSKKVTFFVEINTPYYITRNRLKNFEVSLLEEKIILSAKNFSISIFRGNFKSLFHDDANYEIKTDEKTTIKFLKKY